MTTSKTASSAARKERLAAQLRANLKKRKAQSRARLAQPGGGSETDMPGPHLRGPDPSAKA